MEINSQFITRLKHLCFLARFSVKHFGGEKQFKKRQQLELKKKKLCKENNIKLIYYTNKEYLTFIDNNEKDVYFTGKEKLKEFLNKQHI